jgi:hypothetical protein
MADGRVLFDLFHRGFILLPFADRCVRAAAR